jgi:hypothetical protein
MNPSSHDRAAAHILEDLSPVTPLAGPWQRTLPAAALGLVLAAGVFLKLGVRHDARLLGGLALWGLSALQAAYGIVLIATALQTAIPGRAPARRRTALMLLAGGGAVIGITWMTWLVHPSHVPSGREALYLAVCLPMPLLVGLPTLGLSLFLAFRAYPTTPVLTGALAGLGAGLISDGSWRTFCEVSDPVHVLTSHTAAVVLLMVAGMLAARFAAGRNAGISAPPVRPAN